MAKKKSKKKNNMKRVIFSICIIVLALVTVCTLFMPCFVTKSNIAGVVSNSEPIKGTDVITALFNGKNSTDFTTGANSLIFLKNAEDTAFVTNLFVWCYFLTVLVSMVVIVFEIISLLGIRFNLLNIILGIALAVFALVAFITFFVVANKLANHSGMLSDVKTLVSVGGYFMLLGLTGGVLETVASTK